MYDNCSETKQKFSFSGFDLPEFQMTLLKQKNYLGKLSKVWDTEQLNKIKLIKVCSAKFL